MDVEYLEIGRYKVDTDVIQTYTARSVDSAEMEKRSTMEELMEVLSALKPEIDFTKETELAFWNPLM